MGRPSRYGEADILAGARHVSAEIGPHKLTIAKVAQRAGVPVGSIYHRYASRDEILAAVWLELVEAFQAQWIARLDGEGAIEAGLATVRFTCDWIRRHPREARLLLLHRREDFASGRWPAAYRRRAEALAAQASASLGRDAARLGWRAGAAELRVLRFALVDLPTAALRSDVEAGVPPGADMEALLLHTCAFALRRAARERTTHRPRRESWTSRR